MKTADTILRDVSKNPHNLVKTGFSRLDEMAFLTEGNISLAAGRPGMGKTMLAANIAANLIMQRAEVCYISPEHPGKEIVDRVLAAGKASEDRLPYLYVDDTPYTALKGRTLLEKIRSECPNVKLIIIDYVQLIGTSLIQWLCDAFPTAAVLVLSQVSRAVEFREEHRVSLADIADINDMAPYLYCIASLYRDDYYNDSDEPNHTMEVTDLRTRQSAVLMVDGHSLHD